MSPIADANEEARLPAREAFVRALTWLMEERGVSQRQLAIALDWPSHTKIQPWLKLRSEPKPYEVFTLEQYLKVPPGTLSHHLGFLPLEAVPAEKINDIGEAIEADPMYPDWARRMLINTWRLLRDNAGR